MEFDRHRATAFEDLDVARCYRHRAPYAPEAYDRLLALVPATRRALDLGCGPGKVAFELARHFDAVDAIDPSAAMIEVAHEVPSRVRFIVGRAETAPLEGPYDLVTAGTSIHWMQHAIVFPRLCDQLAEGGVVAFLDGDSAFAPPWEEEWRALIHRWLTRVGSPPDPAYVQKLDAFLRFVDVGGRSEHAFRHQQCVGDFVAKEHSRATWARSRLGPLADEMDREMTELVTPHAEDGILAFEVKTRLVWGTPRQTPHCV